MRAEITMRVCMIIKIDINYFFFFLRNKLLLDCVTFLHPNSFFPIDVNACAIALLTQIYVAI